MAGHGLGEIPLGASVIPSGEGMPLPYGRLGIRSPVPGDHILRE